MDRRKNGNGRTLGLEMAVFLGAIVVVFVAVYMYGEKWLRALLLYLSAAGWARKFVSQTPFAQQVAGRFIAGETIAEAIAVAQHLNQAGMSTTINYLGESVGTPAEAMAAKDAILALLDGIQKEGVDANVSIKPSQLGLHLDATLLYENMRCLLERAASYGNKIRIDMESANTLETTIAIYRRLRDEDGFKNHVGIVIQAYLQRTETDLSALIGEGAWIRLCKGAYAEPADIAFAEKSATDENYVRMMQLLLSEEARNNEVYVGFATHDERMITAVISYVQAHQIPPSTFEFQMLYGVRRDLQTQLVADGYQVRVYVPYGTAWYPYFVRRLAERPANLWFFISNFMKG